MDISIGRDSITRNEFKIDPSKHISIEGMSGMGIKAVKEQLKEQEHDLALLGFVFYDDDDEDVRIAGGDAGRTLRKIIDDQVNKELGTTDDLDARFDSVQVAMMTVASLEDADKLLKSVSSI